MLIIFCIWGGGGVVVDIDLCYRVVYFLLFFFWKVNYFEYFLKILKNMVYLIVVVVKIVFI